MVQSDLIGEVGSGSAECASNAGTYHLPKTLLRITVEGAEYVGDQKKFKQRSDTDAYRISVKSVRVADKRFHYCLDYLTLATSADTVQVKKYSNIVDSAAGERERKFTNSYGTTLLGVVTSNAIDQSRFTLNTLIKAVFIVASGNPNYQIAGQAKSLFDPNNAEARFAKVFHYDLDAFDPVDSARMNASLNDLGYCLILEHYTFDVSHDTINSYCDDPVRSLQRHPKEAPSYENGDDGQRKTGQRPTEKVSHARERSQDYVSEKSTIRGIFYRPRIPYNYFLFIKKNRQAAGGWRLAATAPVPMENIAPVISVGLERAIFSQRKTSLIFDEGMLVSGCIFKTSELQEAINVPLTLVKAVIALPANIVQVRIDQTLGKAQLRKAETELIKTQTQNIAFEREIQKAVAEGRPAKPLSDQPAAGTHTHEDPRKDPSVVPNRDPSALAFAQLPEGNTGLATVWDEVCERAKGAFTSPISAATVGAVLIPQ